MSLAPLCPREFDRFWEIMEASVPRDERRPKEAQRALVGRPDHKVLVARDEHGMVIAFITLWDVGEFTFVEHFAVAPDHRGQGLGAHILCQAARLCSARLCLEVEVPETEIARRRVAFYERNGFCLNHYPYEQPAYAPDRESVPLLIMTAGGGIDRATFEQVRAALYSRVYGL